MKVFVIICLTAILSLAIGAPVQAISAEDAAWQKVMEAAKREGTVTFYTTNFTGKAGIDLSKAFKDKYGISLELITGRGLNMQEKIAVEQKSKSYVADMIDGGAAYFLTLKRQGYFESVAAALPVLKEKDKFIFPLIDDPEAEMLSIFPEYSLFCMNTNLVKPGEEPKSFYDLIDPKWKGKLFLSNPLYNSGPDTQVLVFGANKILNEDYFIKLYKSATLAGPAGASEVIDKVVRGEFSIAGAVSGSTATKPLLAGAPIKPLDLKEGNMCRAVRWGAVKNGPHPNATKVFINWLLTKEGQLVACKALSFESVRNDVPSVLPYSLKGPTITIGYELLDLAEKRYSGKYLANLLGLKR